VVEPAERIAERTGGNPFFIEELIRSLAEGDRLVGKRGAYRMPRPIDDTVIPSSVQSVLAARIDRLSERDRTVLQVAAVVGHEFTERLLGLVAELPDRELRAALQALVAADFLDEGARPTARYAFKHHLTEEEAYRSELAERRRARLHGAVASVLQELYPEKLNELAGLIAHHLEAPARAGRRRRGGRGRELGRRSRFRAKRPAADGWRMHRPMRPDPPWLWTGVSGRGSVGLRGRRAERGGRQIEK
jgi:predicted ATPase